MKKRLVRTCAGVLAALMMFETAFAGNLSARVYADEIDGVYEEVVEEKALELVEEEDAEEIVLKQEAVAAVETVLEEYAAPGGVEIYSIYFDTNGGTLATNPEKLLDARYDNTNASKTASAVIREQAGLASDAPINGVFVPVRTGYKFLGWVDDDGNAFNFDVALDHDMTAHAKWEAKKEMEVRIDIADEPETVHQYDVVEITSNEPNAEIYYRIGSGAATTSDKRYVGKQTIKDLLNDNVMTTRSFTISAIAVKEGCADVSVSRTITVSPDWGDISVEDQKDLFGNNLSTVKPGVWVKGIVHENDYTGKPITFEDVEVYCGTKLLEEGKDFALSYANNTNAYEIAEGAATFSTSKAPALVVTGKGSFTGTYKEYFIIHKININDLIVEDLSTVYNGYVQKLVPSIKFKNNYLKSGTDFKVSYPDTGYIGIKGDEAEYDVKVVGAGNFTGTRIVKERISSRWINEAETGNLSSLVFDPDYEEGVSAKYWIHSEMGNNPSVTVNGKLLLPGFDYDLVYSVEAPKVGTAMVKIVGKGEYAGSKKLYYEITDGSENKENHFNLGNAYIEGFKEEFEYNALPCDQSGDIKVYRGKGQTLLEYGKDYTIVVKDDVDNLNVGEVTIIIKSLNDYYYGKKELTFKIVPRDINHEVHIEPDDVAYLVDGVAEPNITLSYADKDLVLDEDYTIEYKNNTHTVDATEAGKLDDSAKPTIIIKGKGNYKGTVKKNFLIKGSNFYTVRVNPADKVYSATPDNYKTTVQVTDANGKALKLGTDYDKEIKYYYLDETLLDNGILRSAGSEVVAGDIVPYGTCLEVEITPLGSYGKILKYTPQNLPVYDTIRATYRLSGYNIAQATAKVNTVYYTGHEVTLDKSQIQVKYGSKLLSEYDYEIVEYKNNINAGYAKATIRGIGDYFGTLTFEFYISREAIGTLIRFNSNGIVTSGSMANQIVTTYGTVKAPVKLSKNTYKRDYYKFVGWNTKADGTGYAVPADVPLADIDYLLWTDKCVNLYAMWEPIKYTITIHPNGGSFDESLIPAEYDADTVIDELAVPDISTWPKGYMFGGWFLEDTYNTRIASINKGSHGNINLYAKWIAYTYTIEYNSNAPAGKSCATKMADSVVSYGQEKALSANKFAISGYEFAGWSTDPTAENGEYKNSQVITNKSFDIVATEQNNINQVVTLYAVWRKTFSVYLDVVDHVNASVEEDHFEYALGSTHSLDTPVRPGYKFAGWYAEDTYKTKISSITKSMASDYHLYAKWTPISYTVAFTKNASANTSGTMSSFSIKYDVEKALPATKYVRKGYEFVEWNTKADGTGDSYEDGEVISNLTTTSGGKIILYAIWNPVAYSITYIDNGGDRVTSGPSYYEFGDVKTLPDATKEGYIFGGWFKEPTFKTKVPSIKATMYGDMELYARWTADKTMLAGRTFPITVYGTEDFDWNGAVVPDSYTYGDAFALPSGATAPVRDGYTFAGWYTTPSYSKKITAITAKTYDDINLYAKWTPKTYTVSYKVNAPAGVDSKTITGKDCVQSGLKYGTATALKKNAFKIKGYTFLGWSLEADGEIIYADAQKIYGKNDGGEWAFKNEILYAIWSKDEYNIKYMNVGNAVNYNPNYYEVDDEITLKELQCVGKTFKGWYQDAAYTKKITKISKLSTGNKTLYAKWTTTTFNIKYDMNDKGDENTKFLNGLLGYVTNYFKKVDGSYILPSASRKGYKFLGWSLKTTGEDPVFALKYAPSSQITYYAAWEAEKYTIKYDLGYLGKKYEGKYSISKKTQKLDIPNRPGYEFVGWHIGSEDGDYFNDYDADRSKFIYPDYIGDLELFAEWKEITFHMEYNTNGASAGIWMDSALQRGNDYFYLASAPAWGDRVFVGWNINGKMFNAGAKVNAEKLGVLKSTEKVSAKAIWQ